jgi:AraC-like DNA-binding protein
MPPQSISAYVSSILVIESWKNVQEFNVPLYANGMPTLVFQTSKAARKDGMAGNLTLYGQVIAPDELKFREEVILIAYFLHPHTLKTLFTFNAAEFVNNCIDFNELAAVRKVNLQEQLLNAGSPEACITLLNNFIFSIPERSRMDVRPIAFATDQFMHNPGEIALNDLQRQLNTSARSLHRMFETNVGMSPQLFKRVCQFHHAFQQLNNLEFSRLTDIAYEHGFFDQSHFIRVFKEFTGISPKEYLVKRSGYDPGL